MSMKWTNEQRAEVIKLYKLKIPTDVISQRTGVSISSIANITYQYNHSAPIIQQSRYPIYDKALVMEGDALVLPDLEIPFHHADFVNRVLDLAQAWGINQCIIPGDAVHFDCFSGWQPSWAQSNGKGVNDAVEEKLIGFVMGLPSNFQDEGMSLIIDIGLEDATGGISEELATIRKTMAILPQIFKLIHWDLGNHEGRFLRTINQTMLPNEMLKWLNLDEDVYKIAPYYFSFLDTEEGRWRLSHPSSTAKYAHVKMADKYDSHFAMCHSHSWVLGRSTSGSKWAIQMGHCVDERRLPYAAQRDNPRDEHCLGALIIREGYPYLLSPETKWDRMKKM